MSFTLDQGYRLSVTTWENDADNYKTNVVTVKTIEMAKALRELCKYFTSCNNTRDMAKPIAFGNSDIDSKKFGKVSYSTYYNSEAFTSYLREHEPELLDVIAEYEFQHGSWVMEDFTCREEFHENVICELVHELVDTWADGEYLRVVESVDCVYVPETVTYESVEL